MKVLWTRAKNNYRLLCQYSNGTEIQKAKMKSKLFCNQILASECFRRSSIEQSWWEEDNNPSLHPTPNQAPLGSYYNRNKVCFPINLVQSLVFQRRSWHPGTHCLGKHITSHPLIGVCWSLFLLGAGLCFNNHWMVQQFTVSLVSTGFSLVSKALLVHKIELYVTILEGNSKFWV